jgi:hypothetical protein
MSPLDLWPEYKEVKAASKPTVSHGIDSKFSTLAEAKKNLAPVDYAVSLLAAFASQWEEDVDHHSRQGANHTFQEAASRVMHLKEHEDLKKTLQTLLSHLRRDHPRRDPLFLKSTQEIFLATETWESVKESLKNLQGLKGAYPEEVKIEELLNRLIASVNQYIKEADFKKQAESQGFHGIFQTQTPILVDLILKSGQTEKKFRQNFFPQSIQEENDERFEESAALWKRMWDIARNPSFNTDNNTKSFFEWLKKRGETHEED